MRADAVWAPVRWPGLEHAVLTGAPRAPRLDSLAVLTVAVSGPGAPAATRLALRTDGEGRWADDVHHGPVPELAGCIDVDLSSTPLTNTLPIRRLGLAPGMIRDVMVAYIKIPELTVSAVAQRYTCTTHDGDRSGYQYESGSFRADLQTDEHGLVLDYPGVWRRLASASD
jgi:hypothetical protein